jgi:hypothetical protein
MVDYDFSTLNDKEFEDITLELISRDRGKKYQRFKQGRDGGIDGIFFVDENKEEVVQCKHFLKSGTKQLINKLKKEELVKVQKIAPSKYIFITSLPLSNNELNEIFNLFKPFIKSKQDIYYQEKLNNILRDNKDIEERYYKLWLNSITVLNRICKNSVKGRSEFSIEEIKENTRKYVYTENYYNALKILDENKILILTGEPGIGKTSLANNISLFYIEKGFEYIEIDKLDEAEDLFHPDEKQIFYFDDFLGSNYLEALERKDSKIINFMKRINRHKNKRFILTTRTIIFNQALHLSDKFISNDIENKEFILKVEALSAYEKALILYNHIFFSDLSEEFIEEIYKEKRYMVIIKHKNFNPRLIEFITSATKMRSITKETYWDELLKKLNNPYDIWENTFETQSDEYMRLIIILVVFNGNHIHEKILKDAYQSIIKLENLNNNTHLSKEFKSVIKQVTKYFVNRTQYNRDILYTLFNPSIADYIINRYKDDSNKLMSAFVSLSNKDSIHRLNDLFRSKTISKTTHEKVLIQLYKNMELNLTITNKNIDYVLLIFYWIKEYNTDIINEEFRIKFFNCLIQEPCSFRYIDIFFETLLELIKENKIKIKNYNFIATYISECLTYLYAENINAITFFIDDLKIKDKNILDELEYIINEYLKEEVSYDIENLSTNDVDISSYWGEPEIETNIEDIYEGFIDEKVKGLEILSDINIDYSNIKNEFDFDDIEQQLINDYISENDTEYFTNHKQGKTKSIDELFER